ncbi:hypothetical protein EST38_g2461 [Candolleomyces aberdarensis]|uniref:Uncharacterized protein n=1 Tax=Candolleomyces aberdarensis TaxID=2316362 RepID=A0A4Q2DT12_9AGAR|nr:hypothetical protein EST38_g2461 [Candolleomyces aberdarensis]
MYNDVISRFVTWQLARRYPLIFGFWCKQLAAESSHVVSIHKSINAIIKRSANPSFREHCRSLLKILRRHARKQSSEATDTLREQFSTQINNHDDFTTEEVFLLAMENIYKLGLKRRRFKGLSRVADDVNEDEEQLLRAESSDNEGQDASDYQSSPPILDIVFSDSEVEEDDSDADSDWADLDESASRVLRAEGSVLGGTQADDRIQPLGTPVKDSSHEQADLSSTLTSPTLLLERWSPVTPKSIFSDFEDTDLEEDDDDLGLVHPNAETVEVDEAVSDQTPVPTASDGGSMGSKSLNSAKPRLCSRRTFELLLWDDVDDHSLTLDDSQDLLLPIASSEEAGEFFLDESGSEAAYVYEQGIMSDREGNLHGSMLGLVGEADLGNYGGEYGAFRDYGLGLGDTEMDL